MSCLNKIESKKIELDKIKLRGMKFFGCHGCYAEEKKLGQNFFVDVVLFCDLQKAMKTDDLRDTINYGDVFKTVKTIVEGPSVNLLEHLAQKILQEIFEKFSMVEKIELTIHKPQAPIRGNFSDVCVQIERRRDDFV